MSGVCLPHSASSSRVRAFSPLPENHSGQETVPVKMHDSSASLQERSPVLWAAQYLFLVSLETASSFPRGRFSSPVCILRNHGRGLALSHQGLESDTSHSLAGILIITQGNDRKNSKDFARSFHQPKTPSAFLSKLNFKRKINWKNLWYLMSGQPTLSHLMRTTEHPSLRKDSYWGQVLLLPT